MYVIVDFLVSSCWSDKLVLCIVGCHQYLYICNKLLHCSHAICRLSGPPKYNYTWTAFASQFSDQAVTGPNFATFHADSFFMGPVAACMQPAMANTPVIEDVRLTETGRTGGSIEVLTQTEVLGCCPSLLVIHSHC